MELDEYGNPKVYKKKVRRLIKGALIYDIETDSKDPAVANLKWFGAYSYEDDQYYTYTYKQKEEIQELMERHKVLIGFNNRFFDDPILAREIADMDLKFKSVIDLYEVSKKRLGNMGVRPVNFKLKTIVEHLGLDKSGKGDIDYTIFQKDEWSNDEIELIKEYLNQDIVITKRLFDWFKEQFAPLKQYMSEKDNKKYIYVSCSTASLAYRTICNMCDLDAKFKSDEAEESEDDEEEEMDEEDEPKKERMKISGGHHVWPRDDRARGHIISVDFVSAYPHSIFSANLLTPKKGGWSGESKKTGNPYYQIGGEYDDSELGKMESALQKIFHERLKAKKAKDKIKTMSYKIIINSFYGCLGNNVFSNIYDPVAAGDCTSIVRNWMKRLGYKLEMNGYRALYGFTDSVMCLLPPNRTKEDLMKVVREYVEEVQETLPFPQETFNLEIDKEMKFIWVVTMNNYLWVNMDDTIGYRATLFNKNTPPIIMDLFNDYMAPKIIRELDVNFSEQELKDELKKALKDNLDKAGQEYNVNDYKKYKSKTSMQYNISKVYGEGKHFLIPNLMNIGIGKAKGKKGQYGRRYCTIQEFEEHKLTINDIDLERLMRYIGDFYTKEKKKTLDKDQTTLKL